MQDSQTNQSAYVGAVEAVAGALSDADLARLSGMASHYARITPGMEAEDLIQEAMLRILRGDRQWPPPNNDVSFVAFFGQVCRSIASHRRQTPSVRREIVVDFGGSEVPTLAVSAAPEETYIDELDHDACLAFLRAKFDSDSYVLRYIECRINGFTSAETCDLMEISEQQRMAASKRLMRGVRRYCDGKRRENVG